MADNNFENTPHNTPEPDSFSHPNDTEHETHVSALLLLVLVTTVIVGAILIYGQDTPQTTQDTDSPTQVQVTATPVETTDRPDTSDLPESLQLPATVDITRNGESQFGSDRTQRVLRYSTSQSTADLLDRYRTAADSLDLQIKQATTTDYGAAVVATASSTQLTTSIRDQDDRRQVIIDYIYKK